MKKGIVYFPEKGPENTEETLKLAKKRAKELGITYVVVASTSGETGVRAIRLFEDTETKVVVVTHQAGYKRKGTTELKDEFREVIRGRGTLVIGSDPFARVPKLIIRKYGGTTPLQIVADTLRLFSEGVKACVECVVKAADSEAIPIDEEVMAIAGTGRGADTAVVIKPAHIQDLFEMDIREIVAIPRKR